MGDWYEQFVDNQEAKRMAWLKKNMDLSQQKGQVDLNDLPVPENMLGLGRQRFYIGKWTLKMAHCKPYEKS